MKQELDNTMDEELNVTNSLSDIKCDSDDASQEKKTFAKGTGYQTDKQDFSQIIKKIVMDRIDQIQSFDANIVEQKITKIEDENKNLKKRESILLKRLVQLEEVIKKRQIQEKDEVGPYQKKRRAQMESEQVESIKHLGLIKDLGTKEIVSNEFCPTLFRPTETQTDRHTRNDQRKVPMQKVTPLQNAVETDLQHLIQKQDLSVYTAAKTRNDSEHSQLIRQYIPHSQDHIQNNSSINERLHHMLPILNRVSRPQEQHQMTQLRQLLQAPPVRQGFAYHETQQELYLSAYRSAMETNHAPQITSYQYGANVHRHPQRLPSFQQTVQGPPYTSHPTQPPPPYQGVVGRTPLPQLTVVIRSTTDHIILTWDCLNESKQFQRNTDVYLIYAFRSQNINKLPPPDISLWKRIGATNALPLPITCNLTKAFAGENDFFTVLPVDKRGRLGELSYPSALKRGR